MTKIRKLKESTLQTEKRLKRKIKRLRFQVGQAGRFPKKFERLSRDLATAEAELSAFLQANKAKQLTNKEALKKIEKLTKPTALFELGDGQKVFRPEKFVPTEMINTFADPLALEYQKIWPDDDQYLTKYTDKGHCAIILRKENKKDTAVLPVLFSDIQKARSQRFSMLSLNQNWTKEEVQRIQASLIATAIDNGVSLRNFSNLTDSEFIDKYYQRFIESRNELTICSDLLFLTKIY